MSNFGIKIDLSKPVRRQWANGWSWEPSEGGRFIGEEGTKALMEMLGLPKLTWDDEPYRFTVLFTTDELRTELKRKPHIHGYQHIEDNTSYATED